MATRYTVDQILNSPLEAGWAAPLCAMDAFPGGRARCVYVHFCFCCAAGDIALKVNRDYFYDCFCGGVVGLATCTNGICWGTTRTMLREKYRIPGLEVLDIAVVTALPCCYLAQALNHVEIMEMRGGAPLPVALPVAPAQVVMPSSYQAPAVVVVRTMG